MPFQQQQSASSQESSHPFSAVPSHSVVIVGAGISGLRILLGLCSQKQSQGRFDITLIDAHNEPGGLLRTSHEMGFVLDGGAQGVLAQRESWQKIAHTCQIPLVAASAAARNRYLLAERDSLALSPFLWKWVRPSFFKWGEIFRMVVEIFLPRKRLPDPYETVFDFFARRFGAGFARLVVVPLCTGIWGGAARSLLLRYTFPKLLQWEQRYGSVTRGALQTVLSKMLGRGRSQKQQTSADSPSVSLPRVGLTNTNTGMQQAAQSIFEECLRLAQQNGHRLTAHFDCTVDIIEAAADHWIVKGNKAEKLFLCIPPWRNPTLQMVAQTPGAEAHLPQGIACWQRNWPQLLNIPTHDFGVVFIAVPIECCGNLRGFGALAGEASKGLLGVLFVHDIFPAHVPPGCALFRILMGGDRNPECLKQSDALILSAAKEYLLHYKIIISEAPIVFEKVMRQPQAVPLGTRQMDDFLKCLWEIEGANRGLFFAGNYTDGAGVADCLVSAEKALVRARVIE